MVWLQPEAPLAAVNRQSSARDRALQQQQLLLSPALSLSLSLAGMQMLLALTGLTQVLLALLVLVLVMLVVQLVVMLLPA